MTAISLGRMKTALIPHTTLTVTPSYHFLIMRKQKTMRFGRSSLATTPSIGLLLEIVLSPFLATMVFPALFPHATGDPTNPAREYPVSITDSFKHLVKFGEINTSCEKRWQFASHPRFLYWALNMKQQHQLLSQSSVYLYHNPTDANLTVEELQSMGASMHVGGTAHGSPVAVCC